MLHSIVEPHHIATLNMAISVMESVSLLVAMPAIAWSLQFGLGLGGAWIGLPFFVGAAFGFVATAFVLAYRMLQPSQKGQPVDAAVSPADDDEEQQ